MKARLVCVVLVVAVAACCAHRLSPQAAVVRVTSDNSAVAGCKRLGEIKGKSSWGGYAAQGLGDENAYRHLKEAAAEMGGNVVLLIDEHTGMSGAVKRGEAYRCGGQ